MKHLFLFGLLISSFSVKSNAQALSIVFEDVLWGTGNGLMLSTSVMALQKDGNLDHFRWGAGAGIAFGLGTGIYDAIQADGDSGYFVQGLFSNNATATAKITLIDTGYGAALGTFCGLSWGLLSDRHIGKTMLSGYGVGVIGGFLFGLADGFFLSRSSDLPFSSTENNFSANFPKKGEVRISGVRPSVVALPTEMGYQVSPAITFSSVRLHF